MAHWPGRKAPKRRAAKESRRKDHERVRPYHVRVEIAREFVILVFHRVHCRQIASPGRLFLSTLRLGL